MEISEFISSEVQMMCKKKVCKFQGTLNCGKSPCTREMIRKEESFAIQAMGKKVYGYQTKAFGRG